MSFEKLLTMTCDIQRFSTSGNDAWNRPVESWNTLVAGQLCLIQPQQGRNNFEIRNELNEIGISTHVLFMLVDSGNNSITAKDRIVSGSITYEILSVRDAAGQVHHFEIDLRIIK